MTEREVRRVFSQRRMPQLRPKQRIGVRRTEGSGYIPHAQENPGQRPGGKRNLIHLEEQKEVSHKTELVGSGERECWRNKQRTGPREWA